MSKVTLDADGDAGGSRHEFAHERDAHMFAHHLWHREGEIIKGAIDKSEHAAVDRERETAHHNLKTKGYGSAMGVGITKHIGVPVDKNPGFKTGKYEE